MINIGINHINLKSWLNNGSGMKIYFLVFIFIFFIKNVFSQWSEVGMGVNSAVNCLYVDSASHLLFVGGQFSEAGGKSINNVATWNGSNWNQFGNGQQFSSPGGVYAIVNFNGTIIVGGAFDSIGSTAVHNVAKWNGMSWEALGNGFDDFVLSLIVYKNELYACGYFGHSGGENVECFAKWDGIKWNRISELNGYGYSMTIYKNKLIIAGQFSHQTYLNISNIMGWDGNEIDTSITCSLNNAVFKLKNYSDTLYAVGSFTGNILNPSNYVSVFYDQSWHTLGSQSLNDWAKDVILYNNIIYICGYFNNPPDLCKYNGSGYDSVADVVGYVENLIEYSGQIYAGGYYAKLNGMDINSIAVYNDIGDFIEDYNHSIDEIITVYPSPNVEGVFHISIAEVKSKTLSIDIFSIDGKQLYHQSIEDSNTQILKFDIGILESVSILKVTIDNSQFYTKKLICIQH
jgi:hypothetical protein